MGSTESTLPMEDTDANQQLQQEQVDQSNNEDNAVGNSPANQNPDQEDPWWWEIENENLLLDVVSGQTTASSPSLLSESLKIDRQTINESSITATKENASESTDRFDESYSEANNCGPHREQSLEEFKEDLRLRRIARQNAIGKLRSEISTLRRQLAFEKELTRRLRSRESIEEEIIDVESPVNNNHEESNSNSDNCGHNRNTNIDLADTQLALQLANAENLSLRTEIGVVRKQVVSLKEVVACCKQMISVKEEQCVQLKNKLREIEESLAERELKIMSDQLRQEYDRQLENIRTLRQLYEDRQRVSAAERENLERQIAIKKDELIAEQERRQNFEERNQTLEKEVELLTNELSMVKEERNEFKFENKALNEEMGVVNKLFSQMLMGFNGTNNLDIDRLTEMLEENRTLLNDMATKEINCFDGATLPKLLFELVQQAAVGNEKETIKGIDDNVEKNIEPSDAATTMKVSSELESTMTMRKNAIEKVTSAQEIIGNLPKVWKVLMELLSHHKIEQVDFNVNGLSEDCYKYVETPNGQKSELSVSKTYLKLKDLILEKKSLVKETNRLKTLNCHLEYRLNEQEKRLSAVSLELTKTWHLVGKMQRQHRQLHTQEQILRYQLQQKRRLLNELKDELEYCRRKWAAARAKNDESQVQCDDLRKEFARRKLEDNSSNNSNSAESGYSDSGGPVSDEDDAGGCADPVFVSNADDISITARRTKESRKTNLSEMFEHTRRIKRMQSTSPDGRRRRIGHQGGDILIRCNSAPPTIGWSSVDGNLLSNVIDTEEGARATRICPSASYNTIELRHNKSTVSDTTATGVDDYDTSSPQPVRSKHATRIQRLEEQCKSLIVQVLQTSDNRERLEIQLCRFQQEIASPVQFDKYMSGESLERMTRASSAPIMNSEKSSYNDAGSLLTAREEEYTRKRSERLERLEEESRQLMSRIKRTSDRGNYLRSSLERIHSKKKRAASYDDSCREDGDTLPSTTGEATIEQVMTDAVATNVPSKDDACDNSKLKRSPLSAVEEAYSTKRAERLKRLEEESKNLLSKLSCNTNRGVAMTTKLEALHQKYGNEDHQVSCTTESTSTSSISPTIEKRIENMNRISMNRDERLRILEEEGKQLIARLSSTAERGTDIINRIAEREQNRRINQTGSHPTPTAVDEEGGPTTSTLLPTPKTVACSSIVFEEITERVTITRTPSQIDNSQQGAVPKSKPSPTLQLCAAKAKNRLNVKSSSEETLEEMVIRLRNLPFPSDQSKVVADEKKPEMTDDDDGDDSQ